MTVGKSDPSRAFTVAPTTQGGKAGPSYQFKSPFAWSLRGVCHSALVIGPRIDWTRGRRGAPSMAYPLRFPSPVKQQAIVLDPIEVGPQALTVRSVAIEVIRCRFQALVFHSQCLFFGQQGQTFGFEFGVCHEMRCTVSYDQQGGANARPPHPRAPESLRPPFSRATAGTPTTFEAKGWA